MSIGAVYLENKLFPVIAVNQRTCHCKYRILIWDEVNKQKHKPSATGAYFWAMGELTQGRRGKIIVAIYLLENYCIIIIIITTYTR